MDADREVHDGGGFNPPVPTRRGGPDYGRFVDAVRTLQDLARGADAPDELVTEAADLVERVNGLLAPHLTDEWHAPSGRRFDLPNRGSILSIPLDLDVVDGRIRGTTTFRRYHLGRNGAAHGGSVAHLFDSLLGFTAFKLSESKKQRTAFLHVDYRRIVPIGKELQVDSRIDRIEGRKIFVAGRLCDGGDVLAEAEALFVMLKPGQP
ncbi:PaaI family thioesterase [Mycolicibacterium arenosum]|uniref:Acyl-coenzyme A thioesterase THEM4 n=1 Tax=Mycolicibacterium arenosum TaxID=2952157 RepID=A0ABT1M288_9MYCO|nr:PaaI family thioesterase [Mycolicibacterium sp. CAU 1645]MCP9272917.1 PaaI family thioesterase [Mycolicibacterium sp. CAU 1645]